MKKPKLTRYSPKAYKEHFDSGCQFLHMVESTEGEYISVAELEEFLASKSEDEELFTYILETITEALKPKKNRKK